MPTSVRERTWDSASGVPNFMENCCWAGCCWVVGDDGVVVVVVVMRDGGGGVLDAIDEIYKEREE